MITVQLEEADYLAAIRLIRRWSVKMWLFMLSLTLVYLGMGVFLLFFGPTYRISDDWELFLFSMAIFIWVFLAYAYFVTLPKRVRRIFRQQKSLQRPYTFKWTDDSLFIDSENEHAKLPWSDFLKWRESERMFLIFSSDAIFRMVPKRSFPDPESVEGFGRLLREKIGPENAHC